MTLRSQLPAGFSTTVGLHRRLRHATAVHAVSGTATINRIPFDALAQYGNLLFATLSSQPQLGIPTPYAGFAGTVQQALRPYPQFLEHDAAEQTSAARPATTHCRRRSRALQYRVRAARRVHLVEDRRQLILTQDGHRARSGEGAVGRHVPHFLKVTWVYELPIGPGKAIDVDGMLGQIVGGWTMTGIHNYRAGSTLSVSDSRINGSGYPHPAQRRGQAWSR